MAGKMDEVREEQEMESIEDLPENVIRVDFGAHRSDVASAASYNAVAEVEELLPYDSNAIPDDPLASKKYGIFCKYIDNGMVSVTLDPRIKGVSVPAHFADRSELVLNFSHRFFIDDFMYDDRVVCASLSFSGRPYFCVVPWASVKMLLSHHDNAVAVFDADMLY